VISDRPGSAGNTESGTDPEDDGSAEGNQREQGGGPEQQGGHGSSGKWCPGRVNCIDEPQSPAHEIARQDEANGTGGNGD